MQAIPCAAGPLCTQVEALQAERDQLKQDMSAAEERIAEQDGDLSMVCLAILLFPHLLALPQATSTCAP